MSKRVVIWSTSVLAVLLAGVIVALVILISTINKNADDEAYTACVQRLTAGSSSVDELARAAEFCSR